MSSVRSLRETLQHHVTKPGWAFSAVARGARGLHSQNVGAMRCECTES